MIKFAISTTLIHNHLGSASWITDASGTPIQHLRYLPYGETYVNERTSGYNERFTFTGKELDEETGYGYFGARYMDHELMAGWLSVDPMADKYPNISPYAYCAWNPMKLVDPDGEEINVSALESTLKDRL
ncbi:MAG: RHS repeat-associated core domain-containing protein, partial [Bacteroidales bacterium]|nr:RHS repeat-associated core domain-containing protein [Bacteroidales bacterium]